MKKAKSFETARRFDLDYHLAMTLEERIQTVDFLRKMNWKLQNPGKPYPRLKRVGRVLDAKTGKVLRIFR